MIFAIFSSREVNLSQGRREREPEDGKTRNERRKEEMMTPSERKRRASSFLPLSSSSFEIFVFRDHLRSSLISS